MDFERLITEQKAYYSARADEYEDWWYRRGRYDRGEAVNQQWFSEVAQLEEALHNFHATGEVLELACGIGIWTKELVKTADALTCLDASEEVLAINARQTPGAKIERRQVDLFAWTPTHQYDVVFFSFWLSHVPPDRLVPFWESVRAGLKPGGRVFFIDSRFTPASTAGDHHLDGADSTTTTRKLNDGREFNIVKIFYQPGGLERVLAPLGWQLEINETAEFFVYGSATQ